MGLFDFLKKKNEDENDNDQGPLALNARAKPKLKNDSLSNSQTTNLSEEGEEPPPSTPDFELESKSDGIAPGQQGSGEFDLEPKVESAPVEFDMEPKAPVSSPEPAAPAPVEDNGETIQIGGEFLLPHLQGHLITSAAELQQQYGDDLNVTFSKGEIMPMLSQGKFTLSIADLVSRMPRGITAPAAYSDENTVDISLAPIISQIPPEWFTIQGQDLTKVQTVEDMSNPFSDFDDAPEMTPEEQDEQEHTNTIVADKSQFETPIEVEEKPSLDDTQNTIVADKSEFQEEKKEAVKERSKVGQRTEMTYMPGRSDFVNSGAGQQFSGGEEVEFPLETVFADIPADFLQVSKDEIDFSSQPGVKFSKEEVLTALKQGTFTLTATYIVDRVPAGLIKPDVTDNDWFAIPLGAIMTLIPPSWFMMEQDTTKVDMVENMDNPFSLEEEGEEEEEDISEQPTQVEIHTSAAESPILEQIAAKPEREEFEVEEITEEPVKTQAHEVEEVTVEEETPIVEDEAPEEDEEEHELANSSNSLIMGNRSFGKTSSLFLDEEDENAESSGGLFADDDDEEEEVETPVEEKAPVEEPAAELSAPPSEPSQELTPPPLVKQPIDLTDPAAELTAPNEAEEVVEEESPEEVEEAPKPKKVNLEDTVDLERGTEMEFLATQKVVYTPPSAQEMYEDAIRREKEEPPVYQLDELKEKLSDTQTQRAETLKAEQAKKEAAKSEDTRPFIDGVKDYSGGDTRPSHAPNGIDINRCNEDDLCKLHSVGSKMAQQIIAYRNENGPFKSINELRQVPGVASRVYRNLTGLSSRADLVSAERKINEMVGLNMNEDFSLNKIVEEACKKLSLKSLILSGKDGFQIALSGDTTLLDSNSEILAAVAPQLFKRTKHAVKQAMLPQASMFTFYIEQTPVTFGLAGEVFITMVHKGAHPTPKELAKCRELIDQLRWYCSFRAIV